MSRQASPIKEDLRAQFRYWEKTKDLIDQLIDLVVNYRQSGHPGGSRSKVHLFLTTLLSGAMRWDIRDPTRRFADRFLLGAGHTIPLVYCTLAVLNESLRIRLRQTGNSRFEVRKASERALYWEHLMGFRRNRGLSGHAEMQGRTLFLKFNTGPSGHGSPAAAGVALALKRAGLAGVRVFILEGEGGLTPGSTHETLNSAWGLALENLYFLLDWNDFGIDEHPVSASVYGGPQDWFGSHGWRVSGTEAGEDWQEVSAALLELVQGENPDFLPGVLWTRNRKGRGYLKYDYASHGSPHALDSALFWDTKRPFAEKHEAQFLNLGGPPPKDEQELQREFRANLEAVIKVLEADQELVEYLAERLIEIGERVPTAVDSFQLSARGSPFSDERLYDFRRYPPELYAGPGEKRANREALGRWGAWVNSFGAREYGQPLIIASSADLAASTNVAGFGSAFGDFPGHGWYERFGSRRGAVLPQEITEFANAGIMAGIAATNLASDPEAFFEGFWGASSTYGSFSYLLYGLLRLYSQMAQDCELKLGKVIWIAGHSGPETADDSRTHFGIFEPGVTQLFPRGQIINLHPWEFNEVPVLLAAALREQAPIVALHLTRPAIKLPDRQALRIPSHFEAARGAYVVRDYAPRRPKGGTVIVQGTSAMSGILQALPELEELNVKIICAASPQLFALQPDAYRRSVLSETDRLDSMVITTQARWLMHDWIFSKMGEQYALSADWDDRWRTGGTLEEVLEEAHLTARWILEGVRRFVNERPQRLGRLRSALPE